MISMVGRATAPAQRPAVGIAPTGGTVAAVPEAPQGIDAEKVTAWFEANVDGVTPPLAFELIAGGRSNLTFRVTDDAGRQWALRRPPLNSVLASAHDVGREHKIISALGPTDVPVAPTAGNCTDDGVIGAPFYVMEFVDGLVVRDDDAAEADLDEAARRRVAENLVDVLTTIHGQDPDAVGLGDLGKREGYIERQLRRWMGQWEKSKTRELPALEEAHERLAANVPEQGPAAIVHGDYRLDNVIVSPQGDISAVLDWELCTLGDPLADVGLLTVYWDRPYGGSPGRVPGFPTIDEMTQRYAERSGRSLENLDFYSAFGSWKLAAIIEGVYARYKAGAYGDSDPEIEKLPEAAEALAESALQKTR
jgi:aminoglycoside phosphotransferase (APT) family kinase protein